MKEASKKLYQKLPKNKVRCLACQRKCLIAPDKTGFCKTRVNKKGKLYTTIYGIVSSINNDPIEKKPVFHFQPGSNALSLGTFGCNFKCKFCFHPDTNVITERGVLPIKKIFEMDNQTKVTSYGKIRKIENLQVIAHTGEKFRVEKAFRHHWQGELLKVKPYYTPEILCTPAHEVFATTDPASGKTEKIRAEKLTKNHYLLIPKNHFFSQNVTIDLKEFLSPFIGVYKKNRKTSFKDVVEIFKMSKNGFSSKQIGNSFALHPAYVRTLRSRLTKGGFTQKKLLFEKNTLIEKEEKIKFKTEKKPFLNRFIRVEKDFAKLLGYYCAEGWVQKLKGRPNSFTLNFSFGKKERKYSKEVKNLITKIFGLSAFIKKRRTTITVEITKSSLALLFKTLCGSGASEKQVPEIINLSPKPVVQGFLEGYINGDGWVKNNEIAINTTSQKLALGIYWLALKCGFLPRYYNWQPAPKKKIENRTIRQSSLYYVKWKTKIIRDSKFPQRSVKFKEDKNYYFIPITKIKKEKYSGFVYNLEVKKEHSYLANFIAVGNCQNWEISWADGVAEAKYGKKISPQKAIDLAQKNDSAGIAITYNEPTIWVEYSLDVFKLAKKENLYTCWVTNGYATQKSIDLIAPYLDIYRVDLKSFENRFYQKLIGIPKAAPIFEMTKYVHDQYPEIHIECITNIIPTWNDLEKGLKQIANWIVKYLGKKTPWHVTRFFPYAELTDVPPTPPETLFKAREIGLKAGLKFVYIGNLAVDQEDDTFCPKCGNLTIRRTGYSVEVLGVNKNGQCSDCKEDLNVKTI